MDTGGSDVGVEASNNTSAWSGSNFFMLEAMSSHMVVLFWPELVEESGNTVLKSGGVASPAVVATPPQSSRLMRIMSPSEVADEYEEGIAEDELATEFPLGELVKHCCS